MKLLAFLILPALVMGCAGRHYDTNVIVDTKGIDPQVYQQDLSECREFAGQVMRGEKVARSTAGGAILGGAIGAVVGNSNTAQRGAGSGAIFGAAKGVSQGSREKHRVLRNCLRGRGYRVLN